MNKSTTLSSSPSRWTAVLFALGVLFVGMLPGQLAFWLDPNTGARIGLGVVPISAGMFSAVWLIAYPGMGIATWLVWQSRSEQDISIPLAIFAVALLQTLTFWFTTSVYMTAVIDGTGLLLAYTVAWVYSRYRKTAVWWLLPWLLWMPITFSIKIWIVISSTS